MHGMDGPGESSRGDEENFHFRELKNYPNGLPLMKLPASSTWLSSIRGEPSRSAMVRDTFAIRSVARVEKVPSAIIRL